MRTFIVSKKFRLNTHFYSQPESGRKIRLEFSSEQCEEHFKKIFSLDCFNLFCVQSYSAFAIKTQKYNLYKNCVVLKTGIDIDNNRPFVLFQCERIIMDFEEKEVTKIIRKEKLKNLSLC